MKVINICPECGKAQFGGTRCGCLNCIHKDNCSNLSPCARPDRGLMPCRDCNFTCDHCEDYVLCDECREKKRAYYKKGSQLHYITTEYDGEPVFVYESPLDCHSTEWDAKALYDFLKSYFETH